MTYLYNRIFSLKKENSANGDNICVFGGYLLNDEYYAK